MKKVNVFIQKTTLKVISIMLFISLMFGIVPITEINASAAPAAISAVLKANFVERGSIAKLTVTGDGAPISGAAVSYSSADTATATVDSSGNVTGVQIGKTTVTVTADYGADGIRTTSVDIPVVGENLMTRQEVKHGEFQNGVYLNGQTTGAALTASFWQNYGYGEGGVFADQGFMLITDRASHLTGESTKIVRFTFPQLTPEQEADASLTRRDIRLDQAAYLYNGNSGDHSGQIVMDKNKLYECTGWIKAENTGILATDFRPVLNLCQTWDVPNDDGSGTTNKYYELANNQYYISPWSNKTENSGDQDWTYFNLPSVAINGLCTDMGFNEVGGEICLVSSKKNKYGDLLASHISFHEVAYDKMVFTANSPLLNIDQYAAVHPGATIATTVKHYSNTGNEILPAKSVTDGSDYSIITAYSSSNPDVAAIDSSGVITIGTVKGTAIISAAATIGGITKTQNLTVSTSSELSGVKYTYSFITKNDVTWPGSSVRNIKFADTYDNWEYYGVGPTDWATDSDIIMDTQSSPNVLIIKNMYDSIKKYYRYAAFKIHIPKAGAYKPSFEFYDGSSTTQKYRLYVASLMSCVDLNPILTQAGSPQLGATALSPDIFRTSTNKAVTVTLSNVIIPEAGDYLFVIKNLTANNTYPLKFRSLVLDGIDPSRVLASASLSLTDNELYNGETATASVTGGLMSDNTAADLTGSTITYLSHNPEVASVDPSTGVVTGISAGTAQIYATVALSGGGEAVTSESKTVTVLGPIADLPLSGEKYIVDLKLCKDKYTDSDMRPITIEDTTAAISAGMQDYIPWGFAGYDTSIIPPAATRPGVYLRNNQPYGIQMQTGGAGQWVSVRFNIPKPGKYYTLLDYAKSYLGGIGNVYLAPWASGSSSSEWRNSSHLLGTVDYYDKSPVSGNMTELNAVSINTAGDYVLTFETNKKVGGHNMYPNVFTLFGFEHIGAFDFSLLNDTLGYGETDTVSLSGKNTDGTDIDFSIATVSYTSSNINIAGIDNTGKITAGYQAGDTDITVTVTSDGIIKKVTKTLHVIDKEPLTITVANTEIPVGETAGIISRVVLKDGSDADLTNVPRAFYTSDKNVLAVDQNGSLTTIGEGVAVIREEMKYGEAIKTAQITITVTDDSTLESVTLAGSGKIGVQRDEKLKLSGRMSSGYAAYLQNATVSYEIVSCEPAGAITIAQDGTINGVTLGGTATVKATVTLRGVTRESNLYSVTVAEPDAKDAAFNFLKNRVSKPINATLAIHGWEINSAKSSDAAIKSNYHTYYDPYVTYCIRSMVADSGTPVSADTVFNINIPYTGYYRFTFAGSNGDYGADAAIYVDDIYAGEYSFYSASATVRRASTESLRSIPLNSGIHTVTIRSVSKPDKGCYQYFNCMSFWGVDRLPAFDSFAVNLTKDELMRGETATVKARIRLEDGFEFAADPMSTGAVDPYASLTMESSDTNVFTVDSSGVITGTGAGTANVILQAIYNGNTYTKEIPVTVSGNVLSSVEFDTERRVFYTGEVFELAARAKLDNQTEMTGSGAVISFTSSAPEIISISNNTLTANAAGTAKITATAKLGGVTVTNTIDVEIQPDTFGKVLIEADNFYMKLTSEGIQLSVSAKTYLGEVVGLTGAAIEYSSGNPEIAAVNSTGLVTPNAVGTAEITASVTKDGVTVSGSANVTVRNGKIESTFYTEEEIAAARENIEKYTWAKELKDTAVIAADQYAGKEELLWNMVTAEGLPRSMQVGYQNDPEANTCKYCGENLTAANGLYQEWYIDPINDPWKITCRQCSRRFPTNDFESFYKLGLDEHGVFDRELAHEKNDELIAKGETGYLVNTLYPEMGEGWGVDDGFGYDTGRTYPNGVKEVHTYIACYVHWGLWYNYANNPGIISAALKSLRDAYLYTGDMKYGRAGAILIDRIADVYPDFDLMPYNGILWNSHGGAGNGKILGRQWECSLSKIFAQAYDAFFPAMDDPFVVDFLKTKALQYELDNDKSTPEKIRENCEDGILREIYSGCINGAIAGNFGMHQSALGTAAVVLDSMPETKEWIDWIFKKENIQNTSNTGGGVNERLAGNVSRDGFGDEAAPGYNNIWLTNMIEIAEALNGYETYPAADLYKNPKFAKMFSAVPSVMLAQKAAPQIGDSGSTAGYSLVMKFNDIMLGYQRIRDPKFAQLAYWLNGNSAGGIHGDIFTQNPEKLAADIQAVIDEYGEYDWTGSEILPEYGFAILRSGNCYNSADVSAMIDNQRDFWIYYGGASTSHRHADGLNLGIEAYGINFTPDLGYPEATGENPNRHQWVNNTLSHNTVVVNEMRQTVPLEAGDPLHFDSTNRVKLIDADMPDVYSETDIYRRTMVMVEYDSDVSYGIDFFRILGGDDHLYSFHAASEEIYETEGLDLIAQVGGSYAGVNVPWGNDPYTDETSHTVPLKYPQGYTWLQDVRKAESPETGRFAVDFNIKDFRGMLPYPMNLHLRMTMLNDFNLDEVSLATGMPPRVAGNLDYINKLQYVLARRKGTNLNTLFTTVYEPYRDNRYISSVDSVPAVVLDGTEGSKDKVKAVKVTLANGRVDYIVYATNSEVKYRVDDKFDFRGFVGVYTMKDGNPVYSYLNDGDIIGESQNNAAAYTGRVLDFTREFAFENSITVQFDSEVQLDKLAGKCINIANDGVINAVYQIESAVLEDGNKVKLNLGNNTLIRSYKDANDVYGGYIYNIAAGQNFRIPLSAAEDNSPVFQDAAPKTVNANSVISFVVSAVSPIGKTLVYRAASLPRGATFNTETQAFYWVPDSQQVGDNIAVIEVSDGDMAATAYYRIKVLPPLPEEETEELYDSPDDNTVKPADNDTKKEDTQGNATPPVTTDKKFDDTEGFDWAEDAINELAGLGIINGTGPNTFSPGSNITRADFAILLVRALGLTSESGENFADVLESAYYANELAIAKGSGIITGVGENLFNPEAKISRQDIMVIVVRALEKAGYKLESADETTLSEYFDAEEISGYAKAAVAILIKNGIIMGANGKINPKGDAIRAEVAVIIKRILDIKNSSLLM
ncbi:MAG: S-layer homology domain-containing protein [Clostridiaceae bacterium]